MRLFYFHPASYSRSCFNLAVLSVVFAGLAYQIWAAVRTGRITWGRKRRVYDREADPDIYVGLLLIYIFVAVGSLILAYFNLLTIIG